MYTIYNQIRFLFAAIVALVTFYILRKNRYRVRVSIIVLGVFATVISFIPIENQFITFNSIEAVYEYVDQTDNPIDLVVEGEKSDLVVCKNDSIYSVVIYPKTDEGWKIGLPMQTKLSCINFTDGLIFDVHWHNSIECDFYISVKSIDGEIVSISDNLNSKFEYSDTDSSIERVYFTRVEAIDENYTITVNGKEYKVKPIKN